MRELKQLLLPQDDSLGAFQQYVPVNMFKSALDPGNICMGAAYGDRACGVALITKEEQVYLRWVMTDPQARCCGVGTYLLRGALGRAAEKYENATVRCVLSLDMLDESRVSGIFQRVGFSAPRPFATEFLRPFGELTEPPEKPGLVVMPLRDMPRDMLNQYFRRIAEGALPDFADFRKLNEPVAEMCLGAAQDGRFAGLMLCEKRLDAINVRGVYTLPEYRGAGVMRGLLCKAIAMARAVYPPDTQIIGTAISKASFNICSAVFGEQASRHTVLAMEYTPS